MVEQLTENLAADTAVRVALIAGMALLIIIVAFVHSIGRRRRSHARWVIIDGSNVMYWKTGKPQMDAVQDIVAALRKGGWSVVLVFDANAGYLLSKKYRHDEYFAKALGLSEKHVMVVPKGTPADPVILTAARNINARIVTNDRFRDWKDDFPEVLTAGRLTRAENRNGKLWLELGARSERCA